MCYRAWPMAPRALLPALLSALASACGGETAPTPEPAPAPTAPPPPAPATPEPLPPTPPGRAFLVATESGLAPIACFFEQTRSFAAGAACLELGRAGVEVWLMSGAVATITGRDALTCAGEPQPTLTLDVPREDLRGEAVLPTSLREAVAYAPPTLPHEVDRAAPKSLRKRVQAAIAAAHPQLARAAVRVEQQAQLDLDGDAVSESLVVATVPARSKKGEDAPPPAFSGVFLAPAGDAPPTLLRGHTDASGRFTVLGAVDLDGEGTRELYLNTYDDEGFTLSIERVEGGALTTVGEWRCGP